MDDVESSRKLKIDLAFKMLSSARSDLIPHALQLLPSTKVNHHLKLTEAMFLWPLFFIFDSASIVEFFIQILICDNIGNEWLHIREKLTTL